MRKRYVGLLSLYTLTIGLMIYGYTVPLMNCEDIPKDYLGGKDYEKCVNEPEKYLEDVHNTNIIYLGAIGFSFNIMSTISTWRYTKSHKSNGVNE